MSNGLGLRETDLEQITEQLERFPAIEQAIVFGSRAKGTAKPGSDIDLAVLGDSLTNSELNQLQDALEEQTRLPYFFDVVDLATITNNELLEHINRIGVVIYRR